MRPWRGSEPSSQRAGFLTGLEAEAGCRLMLSTQTALSSPGPVPPTRNVDYISKLRCSANIKIIPFIDFCRLMSVHTPDSLKLLTPPPVLPIAKHVQLMVGSCPQSSQVQTLPALSLLEGGASSIP